MRHQMFPDSDVLSAFLHFPGDMEHILDHPAKSHITDRRAMATTAVDVRETPGAYLFIADMPGLARSDIQVQVEDKNVLTIRGKRKREEQDEESGKAKFIRMERKVGTSFRKFTLPEDVNLDAITASSKDGVLTVKVPKHIQEKPKTVEIQVK